MSIYAPEPQGESALGVPDVLVLRDERATTKEEATYWRERSVQEAKHQRGGLWLIGFVASENEAAGEVDLADLTTTYSLVHRPGGEVAGERVIRRGLTAAQVFRFDGSLGSILCPLVATQFVLGDSLLFPGSTLHPARSDGSTDALRTVAETPTLLASEEDPLQRGVEAEGVTFRPAVDPEGATWLAGTSPGGGPDEVRGDGAETEAAPPAQAPAETWITVVAAQEADAVEGGGIQAEIVGAWSAGSDGTYTCAAYPDDATDDTPPAPVGRSSRFALLPTGATEGYVSTVYAYVSYGRLPHERALDLCRRVREGGMEAPLTPLGFLSDTSVSVSARGVRPLTTESEHAEWDAEAKVWRWFLPDPARVSLRLVRAVTREVEAYKAWRSVIGKPEFNAQLVASTCYWDEHRRGHLVSRLRPHAVAETEHETHRGTFTSRYPDPNPSTNMTQAWSGFNPSVVGSEEGFLSRHQPVILFGSELGHFAYGLRCQNAYLRHRATVAANRLELWLKEPLYEEFERDLDLMPRAGTVETGAFDDLCVELFEGQAAMCAAGVGAGFVARRFRESGLAEKFLTLDVEEFGTLVEPLETVASGPWTDLLNAPAFAVSWSLAKHAVEGSAPYLEQLAVLAVSTRSVTVDPVRPRCLFAVLATSLLGRREVTVEKVSDSEYVAGEYTIKKRDVRRTVTKRTVPFTGWSTSKTVETSTETRIDTAAQTKATRVALIGDAMDVAFASADLFQKWNSGEADLTDAISVGQILSDVVGVHETSVELSDVYARGAGRVANAVSDDVVAGVVRAGRVFAKAGPWLEAAGGAVGVWEGLRYTGARGAIDETYSNSWAVGSAALGGAGSAMIAQVAFAGGVGALTAPAAVIGFVLVGAGFAVGWYAEQEEERRALAADPLRDWLPTVSVWGQAYPAPREVAGLFGLVAPGWRPGRPRRGASDTALEAQSEAFIKEAYSFPVSPREDGRGEGGAVRLALDIAPEYLPTAGTLTVSADVTYTDAFGVENDETVKCAVHYVRTKKGYRYVVMDEGEALAVDKDMAAEAIQAGWASALSVGGAVAFRVYVGAGWTPFAAPEGGAAAEAVRRAASTGDYPRNADAHWEQVAAVRAELAGRLAAGEAPAKAVVAEDRRLTAALEAGSFEVSGTAFFRPLAPVDPAPTVPATDDDGEPTEPGIAEARFERTFGAPDGGGTGAPER